MRQCFSNNIYVVQNRTMVYSVDVVVHTENRDRLILITLYIRMHNLYTHKVQCHPMNLLADISREDESRIYYNVLLLL